MGAFDYMHLLSDEPKWKYKDQEDWRYFIKVQPENDADKIIQSDELYALRALKNNYEDLQRNHNRAVAEREATRDVLGNVIASLHMMCLKADVDNPAELMTWIKTQLAFNDATRAAINREAVEESHVITHEDVENWIWHKRQQEIDAAKSAWNSGEFQSHHMNQPDDGGLRLGQRNDNNTSQDYVEHQRKIEGRDE